MMIDIKGTKGPAIRVTTSMRAPRDKVYRAWTDPELLNRMADRAFEVHDGGRPRCPLCSAFSRPRNGIILVLSPLIHP